MPYQPTFISFAPSYRCNLSCAHCCVPSGSGDKLPLEVTFRCLREATDLGVTAVGFTGGEPMLVCDWVADATQEATRRGLEVDDLSTNGVWWSDVSDLEMRLETLKAAGFVGGFHLSVDAFHAEAGSEKQAKFVRAAIGVFGKAGNLSCAETPKHPAMTALRHLADRLDGEVVEEGEERGRLVLPGCEVPYFRFFVADVGQGSGVGVGTGVDWFGEFDCFGHDAVYVDPAGEAHFCLGFASYTARSLWLGSVAQEGLTQVVTTAAKNPLIQLLCAEGPAGLRRVIEEREAGVFEQPWQSPCAFCHHCLTDGRHSSVLREAGLLAHA